MEIWFRLAKRWNFSETKEYETDQIITIVIGNVGVVVAKARNNKSYLSFN